jgi:hypothetical protein
MGRAAATSGEVATMPTKENGGCHIISPSVLAAHSAVCRTPRSPPAREGLNASDRTAQAGHEGEYLFKRKEGGVEHTKWVKSNSSIHR